MYSLRNRMYRIAIPSLNRAPYQHTIKMLLENGFDKDQIDLFVASPEQAELYRTENPGINVVIGKLGMKEIRMFITDYYGEGKKVVMFDDDIKAVRMKNPRGWEESCYADDELDLKKEIDLAFQHCEASGRHMWGVYPVENHFFMKNEITYDYKFACGGMFGLIIKKELCQLHIDQYEDYERCVRHYLSDGGIVRLNYLCLKTTKMGSNEGGVPSLDERDMSGDLKKLVEMFPGLVQTKFKKSFGLNPVLKDLR